MSKHDGTISLRQRPAESVTLSIPIDTLEAVRREAIRRDMSPEALLKLYIGAGLRQDVSGSFADLHLETATEAHRHVASE